MIASAMQIMNMIVSAMGPFSAKASAEASIGSYLCPQRGKRGKRDRLCDLCFRPVCVPGSTEGFLHEISELCEGVNAGRLAAHALVACDEAQRYLAQTHAASALRARWRRSRAQAGGH